MVTQTIKANFMFYLLFIINRRVNKNPVVNCDRACHSDYFKKIRSGFDPVADGYDLALPCCNHSFYPHRHSKASMEDCFHSLF
ncbi:MAG TPA: hypothetical protein VG676_16265 [Chitinophagaceae bacterium]|nr:hypothetical protein [Chitinophagaceae bacterium]